MNSIAKINLPQRIQIEVDHFKTNKTMSIYVQGNVVRNITKM